MRIVLDSDALIKLAKVSAISLVAESFTCFISEEVFREVVVEGKKRRYRDALTVEELVRKGLIKVAKHTVDERALRIAHGLDPGEATCLHLFFNLNADLIVSDDHEFAERMAEGNVPYLTVSLLILFMAERGMIKKEEAIRYLNSMRGLVPRKELEYVLGRLGAHA